MFALMQVADGEEWQRVGKRLIWIAGDGIQLIDRYREVRVGAQERSNLLSARFPNSDLCRAQRWIAGLEFLFGLLPGQYLLPESQAGHPHDRPNCVP